MKRSCAPACGISRRTITRRPNGHHAVGECGLLPDVALRDPVRREGGDPPDPSGADDPGGEVLGEGVPPGIRQSQELA